MKLRKRILSFILSVSMLGMFAPNILAEDTTGETTPEETVTDTFEVTIKPENYASIYLQKGDKKTNAGGYNGTSRAMNMYYNVPYSENTYIYMHSGSILSEYDVPLKKAISELAVTHYIGKFPSNAKNNGTHPIFYNIGAFSDGLNISNGKYAGPTVYGGEDGKVEYEAIKTITKNYWPVSSTTSVGHGSTAWTSQVAAFFKGTSETTGSRKKAVSSTVLVAFQADENTDMITFATGRATSGYSEAAYSLDAETKIPYLTATYSKSALTTLINNATKEEMEELLEDLGGLGVLDISGYTILSSVTKKYINENLVGTYETFEEFETAYQNALSELSEIIAEDPIEVVINPTHYAGIKMTEHSSYKDRISKGNMRASYDDIPYNDYMRGQQWSLITEYYVPYRGAIDAAGLTYTGIDGQMDNGSQDIYMNLEPMNLNLTAGVYDGPVNETDDYGAVISETTPASEEYLKIKSLANEYWPSGTGYSATTDWITAYSSSKGAMFGNNMSTVKVDIKDTALPYLTGSESDYITFGTGRTRSSYMNLRWRLEKEAQIPKLNITYNPGKIVDIVNLISEDEMNNLITELGKAGILNAATTYGYEAYNTLEEPYKEDVRKALYEEISANGYLTFKDFAADYDRVVLTAANNVINNPDVYINFNDETAKDLSGNNKNGEIVGNATFTEGPDGSKALKIENTFGKTAEQYLNLGEYDLSNDSFSFVFWMKAPERGIKYEESGDSITAETPVDFSTYTGTSGGVVLSNKDFSVNDNTGFAFAAMPLYADFSFNMKLGEGAASNTVGIQTAVDSRWHQIAFVVNRQGKASFYVDNTLTKEIDISKIDGSLGIGDIIFGADGLGQYGMNKGEFDDIKFYLSALEANKIEELYYKSALNNVNNEIETLLESEDTKYYSEDDIDALEEKLADSKVFVASYESGNTASMIAHFDALDAYFNNFLGKGANTIAAWGSDVHISEAKETHLNAQNLNRFLTESSSWENPAKTFIISGDIADVGADDMRYFFGFMDKWVVDGSNIVLCRGNHDEPVGSEKDTGVSYTREELKNKYVAWTDKYVDKTLALNADILDSEGNMSQPFYYSTDGAAHYISVDIYWPTVRSISDTQIAWLRKVLDTVSGDGKPIFFIMHAPLHGTHPSVETDKNGLKKEADTKIKNLVKDYDNIFILTGHHHAGFGSGAGNPYKVKLDDGTETGVWLINTTLLCSKTISRGYEWAGGYYINVYDDKVVFRGRDFENQKWLREYDLSFDLVPAKENKETAMGEIELINLEDGSEYANIADAEGKLVKVQVPVTFADETAESFATVLAFYNGEALLGAKIGDVSVNDGYIEYEIEIPSNTTEIKVMCWETVGNMVPVCEATER